MEAYMEFSKGRNSREDRNGWLSAEVRNMQKWMVSLRARKTPSPAKTREGVKVMVAFKKRSKLSMKVT